MPEQQDEFENVLAPFVQLLGAHMDLISETSEETALRMSEGLSALRKSLIEIAEATNDSRIDAAIECTAELHSLLQSQDILRQQVVAVRCGLDGLSDLRTDDVSHHIEELKDGYVMPQQWNIHARLTGEDATEPTTDAGPTFF